MVPTVKKLKVEKAAGSVIVTWYKLEKKYSVNERLPRILAHSRSLLSAEKIKNL